MNESPNAIEFAVVSHAARRAKRLCPTCSLCPVFSSLRPREPARVLDESPQIVFAVYATQRQRVVPAVVQPDLGRHSELVAGAGDLALRSEVVIAVRIAECSDLSPDRVLNPVPRLGHLLSQPLVAEAGQNRVRQRMGSRLESCVAHLPGLTPVDCAVLRGRPLRQLHAQLKGQSLDQGAPGFL